MASRTLSLVFAVLAAIPTAAQSTQTNPFRKVMITEVSYGDPDCVEITNFDCAPVTITGWRVVWQHDPMPAPVIAVFPAGTVLQSGESVVVRESSALVLGEVVPPTQVFSILPSVTTTTQALEVALLNAGGGAVDKVVISSSIGAAPALAGGPLPGTFFGMATRGTFAAANAVGVERVWGLDSDGGFDWTEQPDRSMGWENRSSNTTRGVDSRGLNGIVGGDGSFAGNVMVSEIDDAPDYVELFNRTPVGINLQGWFLLCSDRHGGTHEVIRPFPGPIVIPAFGFLVIGDGAAPPPEKPLAVPYVNLALAAGGDLPFEREEYDCALYDNNARLVDIVRTSGFDAALPPCEQLPEVPGVAHNNPRAPSHWQDFTGIAGRTCQTNGDGAIARRLATVGMPVDTNTGADWRGVFGRTMGAVNANFADGAGLGDRLDARINATWTGSGLTIILNAGPPNAANVESFFVSTTPSNGIGPFFGLGMDALFNWLSTVEPSATLTQSLDPQGSARVDLCLGCVPPGLALDLVFFLRNAARTSFLDRSWTVEYTATVPTPCPF